MRAGARISLACHSTLTAFPTNTTKNHQKGFDCVSTMAEEVQKPERDMPVGIISWCVFCVCVCVACCVSTRAALTRRPNTDAKPPTHNHAQKNPKTINKTN